MYSDAEGLENPKPCPANSNPTEALGATSHLNCTCRPGLPDDGPDAQCDAYVLRMRVSLCRLHGVRGRL